MQLTSLFFVRGVSTLLLISACQLVMAQTAKKPKVVPEVAAALPVLPVLTEEHKDIAQRVQTGVISCELGQNVHLRAHAQADGHFVLDLGRQTFIMQPVATTSGAVRLEDLRSGAVWLQLANKSMLMNQRQGKRLADACVTPQQFEVARALIMYPPKSDLD